jgi:orotate phosphoribosyltransferase-like protein
VIVATGRIHKEAGVLLQNHSRRRVSGGQDFEMIIADDVATAGRELEQALERVSQRVVAEQLCVLDNSIGFSVSRLVLTKFRLVRHDEPKEVEVVTEPEFVESAPLSLAAYEG